MKTDKEIMQHFAKVGMGSWDDYVGECDEDKRRERAIHEHCEELRRELTKELEQIGKHYPPDATRTSAKEVLLSYSRSGQRDRYKDLFDSLTRAIEIKASLRKWDDLAGRQCVSPFYIGSFDAPFEWALKVLVDRDDDDGTS